MIKKIVSYLREAKEEFAKVTWPSKKDTLHYSLTVVVISLILALFIGLMDYAFNLGLEKIISSKPASVETPQVEVNDIQTSPVEVTTEPAN